MPLASQLSQQLSWMIVSGILRPGHMLPPVREAAATVGVNLHTVRAAYRRLELDGLVSIRVGAGTVVRPYDRSRLAASAPDLPTFTVGVITAGLAPFYSPVLRGIQTMADPTTLFFVCDTHDDPRLGLRYLDLLTAKGVDGIIGLSVILPPDLELPLPPGGPPLVLADFPGTPGPGVEFDLRRGAADVTRHLLDHGHLRIGLIAPPAEWPNVGPRHEGFREALGAAGLEPDPDLTVTVPGYGIEEGAWATAGLLDLREPPTAIWAMTDALATGALRALRTHGVRVPADVSVAGFDDVEYAALLDPALTTVRLPAREMGERAMMMLRRLMAGSTVEPVRETLPTQLVIRDSCGTHR
jgi:DNA-binding LacI/PurR family transcriptional regulator